MTHAAYFALQFTLLLNTIYRTSKYAISVRGYIKVNRNTFVIVCMIEWNPLES